MKDTNIIKKIGLFLLISSIITTIILLYIIGAKKYPKYVVIVNAQTESVNLNTNKDVINISSREMKDTIFAVAIQTIVPLSNIDKKLLEYNIISYYENINIICRKISIRMLPPCIRSPSSMDFYHKLKTF